MDRGAWQAAVRGVTQSQTRLSTHTGTYTVCPSPLGLPAHPRPHPTPPSSQSTELSPPCPTAASHEPFISHVVGCVHVTPSVRPTLPFLPECISIPVSFLSRPHLQTPLRSCSSYLAEKPGVQPGLPGPPQSRCAKPLKIRASAVPAV